MKEIHGKRVAGNIAQVRETQTPEHLPRDQNKARVTRIKEVGGKRKNIRVGNSELDSGNQNSCI